MAEETATKKAEDLKRERQTLLERIMQAMEELSQLVGPELEKLTGDDVLAIRHGDDPGELDAAVRGSVPEDLERELGLLGRHPAQVVVRLAAKLVEQQEALRTIPDLQSRLGVAEKRLLSEGLKLEEAVSLNFRLDAIRRDLLEENARLRAARP